MDVGEILTVDIVQNRVDYGTYEARFPTETNLQSSAYEVIRRIYSNQNWVMWKDLPAKEKKE